MNAKKILISGGGIAGVSLAAFLENSGHDVTIIEKASGWRTIGYAVGIWKPGLNILQELGADNAFWDKTYIIQQGAVLNKEGRPLVSFPFQTNSPVARTMLREDLHTFLYSKLFKTKVRFNTIIKDIQNELTATKVRFHDDSEEHFDLVVIADGTRSKTRELVFGQVSQRYGWAGWATWESTELSHFDGYYLLSAPGSFFLSLPYRDRATVGFMHNIKDFDMSMYDQKHLEETFKHVPFLQTHIAPASQQDQFFCDEMVFVHMTEWYKNRVVIIGDARHGVSPISGFGTTLALGDAQTLAEELQKPQSLDDALNIFSKKRTKEVKKIQRIIHIMESSVMITNPILISVRNCIARLIPGTLFSNWLTNVFH